MTDRDDAMARIAAYLDVWTGDAFYRDPIDRLDGRNLHGADVRAVLAALADAQNRVAELESANERRDRILKRLEEQRDEQSARRVVAEKRAEDAERRDRLKEVALVEVEGAANGLRNRVTEHESAIDNAKRLLDLKDQVIESLRRTEDPAHEARLAELEAGHRKLCTDLAAEPPPIEHVRQRLAENPYGGEQNYLELAEAIWRLISPRCDADGGA